MSKPEENVLASSENKAELKPKHPLLKMEVLLSNNKERSIAFLEAFLFTKMQIGINPTDDNQTSK